MVAAVWDIFLAVVAASGLVTALIYGISVVFLFAASTLYHAFKKEDNELSFWRKMTAGHLFHDCRNLYADVLFLPGWRGNGHDRLQWSLVGFGVISQIFFPRRPGNCTRLSTS